MVVAALWGFLKNKGINPIIRHFLERNFGKYFKGGKIKKEQLLISTGDTTVENIELECESINRDLNENTPWGIEVTEGEIGSFKIKTPWSKMLTGNDNTNIEVEVENLKATLRPNIKDTDNNTSMMESISSSVSNSLQIAQEYLEHSGEATFQDPDEKIRAMEYVAQRVESVMVRIKTKFVNTELRLEYLPPNNETGIAVIIKIEQVEYENEGSNDDQRSNLNVVEEEDDNEDDEDPTAAHKHFISTYKTSHITMRGITIYTEEFRVSKERATDTVEDSLIYSSAISQLPEPEQDIARTKQADLEKSESARPESEEEDVVNIYYSSSVMIAKFEGKQEIRIKMKQLEDVTGPKVILDLQLGAFNVFLTPRQIHLLNQFCDLYLKEPKVTAKTEVSDRNKVKEQQKIWQKQFSMMSGNLGNEGGWVDPNEEIASRHSRDTRSVYSDVPESLRRPISPTTSMTTSCTSASHSRYQRKIDGNEFQGEMSYFTVNIASLRAVVLQEDILLENSQPNAEPVSDESVRKLIELSEKFFEQDSSQSNVTCERNHLKVILAPIIIEGEEERTSEVITLNLSAMVTTLNLDEVLQNELIPLIEFDRKDSPMRSLSHPEFRLNIKSSAPVGKRNASPKTDIHFNLHPCTVELDISMYDRLSAILSTSPFKVNLYQESVSPMKIRRNDPITEIALDAPSLDIRLRIPIPDSRPIHDPERIPWWKKNVRPDFFLFNIFQFRLKHTASCVEITANKIDLYHSDGTTKTHVLKTTLVEEEGKSVDYPKITIEFPPAKSLKALLNSSANDSDSGETSGESSKFFQSNREAPPFSSKRVHRSSDTSHDAEEETILLPGEKPEIQKFREQTMNLSKLQFKIHLAQASVQLKSKYFFEIIYNRINTDLLMWEPCAPNFTTQPNLSNIGMTESCYNPSTVGEDEEYNSGSDDEFDSDMESYYRSAYARRRNKRSQPLELSGCSFELFVKKGILTMFAPLRDNENRVIPGQFGEFVFRINDLNLFSVSKYNGDNDHAFLCLESSAEMFHAGLIPCPSSDPPLRLINSPLPEYLYSTLYPTPQSLTLGHFKGSQRREQLTLITEIRRLPDLRVKRLRLTAGIQTTTLRHNPAPASYSWLSQLVDMFDVLDYPIEGYKPYGIVTEMQLHLWDCAVDYRPKYLPYRAVVELGSVMISSNLTTCAAGSTLRFVFEDGSIAIAPYDCIKHTEVPTNCVTCLSEEELVSVIDFTLLDFSLRRNEFATNLFPKFDFRASNPDMHLRTCTDSAKAISDLLLYIAEDGDLRDFVPEDFPVQPIVPEKEENLLPVNEPKVSVPEISREQQERVTQLITEAIMDQLKISSESSSDDDSQKLDDGTHVSFVFPDEKQKIEQSKQKEGKMTDSTSSGSTCASMTTVRFVARSKSTESPEALRSRPGSSSGGRRSESESDFGSKRRDSENDLRDIIDFETSVMKKSYHQSFDEPAEDPEDSHPLVREELGDLKMATPTSRRKRRSSRRNSVSFEEDFHVIAEEEREYMKKCGKDIKLSDDPLRIVDNHFSLPEGKPDLLKAPENFPMAVKRYVLCEMSFTWHMYGGNDFPKEDDKQSAACRTCTKPKEMKEPMSDAYRHGVSFSKDQQRVQFIKSKPKPKLSYKTIGGPGRDHDVLVEIQISKARFSHETYPSTTMQSSRQVIVVNELEIRDRLQCSDINKFLYHQQSKLSNKNIHPQLVIKALHVRPDPRLTAEECSLRISSKNLKLHIDQDCLLFLAKFFNELSPSALDDEDNVSRRAMVPKAHPPIMMVDDVPAVQEYQAKSMISTNLDLLLDDDTRSEVDDRSTSQEPERIPYDISNDGIYFKDVFFGPDVSVLIDYVGKTRLDNTHGAIAGFLMGLGQLQCSEIRLKKINKHGIKGIDQVLKILLTEWLKDIKKNQLGDILKGIGAVNTIIQIVQGFVDLFWLPIQQYRRDGRIVRGLQLGAQSFLARTTLAALEITTRIIELLQITAETAYDMLSPGPSVRRLRHTRKGKRKRLYRPRDLREGVVAAYQIVKEGFSETASNLIETAAAEKDQKGVTGAVGAVVRQIPPLVVSPMVYATQATTNVLGGVKNQLIPDAKMEAKEKWKDDTE